jgi:hypothetical protein
MNPVSGFVVTPAISTARVDEAARGTDLDGEEVGCGDRAGMRVQERAPRGRSLWRRRDSGRLQDLGDGGPRHFVADVRERADDARVAPARVLPGHADGQPADARHDCWPARAPVLGRGRPLRRDEAAMPAHERVGCHDRGDGIERRPSEGLRACGQSGALRVVHAQPPLAELLAQHTVLLAQVVDDLGLLAVDEAGEDEQQEAEREQGGLA